MIATNRNGLTIQATDMSGQKVYTARDIAPDATIGELIQGLLPRMGLVDRIDDQPIAYRARLDREGRHLNASERVSDALQTDDRIVLAPTIEAG